MAKSITLGNGNLLICYDNFAQVDELYYPYVGLENQLAGKYVHRVGVFVDGTLYWLDHPTWQIRIDYLTDALAANVTAVSNSLQLELKFQDVVYNEQSIYLRHIEVINHASSARQVKIFFNQQFEIYESMRGDTAYYDPEKNVVIHYKGRRVFLINARSGDQYFDDYSVGLFGIEGKEGTFKDAEDGELSKNPIEHGLVDSVIGLDLNINAEQSQTVEYWLCVGKYVTEVLELNDYVLSRTPEYLLESTTDYWKAWVNMCGIDLSCLSVDVARLFKNSLLTIRSHVDNRGAIIASGDSDLLKHGRDTYSYMWPRDGGFASMALSRAGYHTLSNKFIDFCNTVITEKGYFMHKYRADRSLGSSWHSWIMHGHPRLPIQEDETALVLVALWEYYQSSKNLEFIEEIYNSLIKKAATFLVDYRDPLTHLPLSSYDLWEERYGVSTYTASSVYGGLIAASKFAQLLGKETRFAEYTTAANQIKQAIIDHLYNPNNGNFYKLIVDHGPDTPATKESTLDASSVYGIFKFGVMSVGDPRLDAAFVNMESKLWCKSEVGGIVRYEEDNYFRVSKDVPGNPWIITTLWLAQYYIARAETIGGLDKPREILDWCVKSAAVSGVMPEQLNPFTGEHLSATPLTWSHAQFVDVTLDYIAKHAQLSGK